MSIFKLADDPHQRLNPLTGEWLLVSPHRAKRPWNGGIEKVLPEQRLAHDPECYLCPRNTRANGEINPDYKATFTFTNDFSALLPDSPEGELNEQDLLVARSERGLSRVICFSPRHDLSLAEMSADDILPTVQLWVAQTQELGSLPFINHVQIFENKGAMVGCSNPHPHGQIWASEHIPAEPTKELAHQRSYLQRKDACLLCDYLEMELAAEERIICANDCFVALVPFWACWPFETMILSRRHCASISDLSSQERYDLADILQCITARYDNLFKVSFPYSMGWHQMPTDGESHEEWHLHAHFFPPLLRSATVKKFLAGFEMFGNPQRDITPESAAEQLRELSDVHYKVAGALKS